MNIIKYLHILWVDTIEPISFSAMYFTNKIHKLLRRYYAMPYKYKSTVVIGYTK